MAVGDLIGMSEGLGCLAACAFIVCVCACVLIRK